MFKKPPCKPIQHFSIIFIVCAILSACSGLNTIAISKIPPDWVLGEPAKYPNALYLSATGSASDVESAKDLAMDNLAKIFESHIVGSTTTTSDTQSQTVSSGTKLSGEEVSIKQRLLRRVNVRTDKVLAGIQIAEKWRSVSDSTYYALAVINRQKAGNILRNEMQKLDKDTAFELDAIESQKDDLKRISAFQRIINFQEERNNLQKTLKVIDLKGKGIKQKWHLVELKAFAASALSEIKMSAYVQPQGHSVAEQLGLKLTLQAAMSHAGFPAVDGNADYTLLAEVDIQGPQKKQGWYWQTGTLEIRLIDAKSGITRGSHSWELKVSASQQSQLLSRFKQMLGKTLKAELKSVLIGIADAK